MSAEAIIAGAVGLLGVAASVGVYLLQRRRKELRYAVVARTPLIASAAVPGELEVAFRGAQVKDVYLVTVVIFNPGTEPIHLNDFADEPLLLRLRGGDGSPAKSRILTASVRNPVPPDLQPDLEVGPRGVLIQPLILNSRDRFGVQMLAADVGDATVTVEGRIAGVSRIMRVDPDAVPRSRHVFQFVGGLFVVGSFAVYVATDLFSAVLVGYALALLATGASAWMSRRRQLFFRGLLDTPHERAEGHSRTTAA